MTVSRSEVQQFLAEAVENAYSSFQHYRRPNVLEMSPAKEPSRINGAINDGSLKTLTGASLGAYAGSALWTVGGVDDYRHFLPRILELALGAEPWIGFEPENIASKLTYADWRKWPLQEQESVERVFVAAWQHHLSLHPDQIDAFAWLEGLSALGLDTRLHIEHWQQSHFPEAFLQCAAFIGRSEPALSKGKTVIDAHVTGWLKSRVLAAVLFAASVEAHLTDHEREDLALAADTVEQISAPD